MRRGDIFFVRIDACSLLCSSSFRQSLSDRFDFGDLGSLCECTRKEISWAFTVRTRAEKRDGEFKKKKTANSPVAAAASSSSCFFFLCSRRSRSAASSLARAALTASQREVPWAIARWAMRASERRRRDKFFRFVF